MKSEFDKEIDGLLRGHAEAARRGGASTSAAAGAARSGNGRDGAADSPAHLDADELSAYAENALPAPARLRYAAHLADCDNCRRIVTRIALASGVAGELDKREAAAANPAGQSVKASRLAWLAGLFSPRALRYVAPVVVAALVGVVGFVALRQSSNQMSLAPRNERNETANVNTTDVASRQTETTTATMGDANQNANANAPASVPAGTLAERAQDEKSKAVSAPGEMAKAEAPSPAKDAGGGSASNVTSETTTPAPPPASKAGSPDERKAQDDNFAVQTAPAPPVQSADKERVAETEETVSVSAANAPPNRAAVQNRKRSGGEDVQSLPAQNRAYEQQQTARNEEPRDEDTARVGQQAGSRGRSNQQKAAPELSTRAPRRSDTATTGNKSANAAPETETRSIAGRRFSKRNGVWVDTAYDSSQSPADIARGSERFRSLVADEPKIARIARELEGTIIVVWKNRVYRIK